MRRQLMEALAYPSLLVRQLMEGGNYPHASLFEATGKRCHKCDESSVCGWDKCLADFRQFDNKSTQYLSESLREGLKLVEALHSELRHDATTCTCETCCWIRNAEHLIEESEHHLPHVEPAVLAEAAEKLQAE